MAIVVIINELKKLSDGSIGGSFKSSCLNEHSRMWVATKFLMLRHNFKQVLVNLIKGP